jgi:hypothetical protein
MNPLTMKRKIALILPGFFFCVCGLTAQQDSMFTISPIETDRPDQTETASLVPKGYFQMENGFSIEDTEPGFIYTHPSTLWKVGVTEHFEIRVITEYINIQRDPNPKVDGFLPVKVGFKSKLIEQNGLIPKTSFIGHLSLPGIASKQFRQTYFAPDMRLAFQHSIGTRYSVGYNLGAEWDGETPRPDFIYTLSVSAGLFNGLSIYGEGYGSVPQQLEDDAELRIDGGFTYLVSNDVLVDISGGIGVTDNAPEKYIAVGLSYRFKM